MLYIIEEHAYIYIYTKLSATVRFGYSSSINGSDETLGCESLPLSRVCPIKGGALKFCHIACEEEASRDFVHLIVNRRLRF